MLKYIKNVHLLIIILSLKKKSFCIELKNVILIEYAVAVKYDSGNTQMQVNGGNWRTVKTQRISDGERLKLRTNIDNNVSAFNANIDKKELTLFLEMGKVTFEIVQPKYLQASDEHDQQNAVKIVAPMPGIVAKVLVKAGDKVKKGDSLAVLIAMKMEHVLKAPRDAIIKSIGAEEGQSLAKGITIIVFEDEH